MGPSVLQTVNGKKVPVPTQGPGGLGPQQEGSLRWGARCRAIPSGSAAQGHAYMNPSNPAAMRGHLRQGGSRRGLANGCSRWRSPRDLADCGGGRHAHAAGGASGFKFDAPQVIAQGQSMGGMYTKLFRRSSRGEDSRCHGRGGSEPTS